MSSPALPVHRDPQALANRTFDLAVIGGGITGCCIARDAARRGLRVALVERGDFSGGTSAATSRLVHGGLRYLKSLQVGVVRESLRERRIWGTLAPDAVVPSTFLLPTFGWRDDLVMRLALGTYDALAFDRNRGLDPGHRIPRSRHLSREALAALEPILGDTTMTGGLAYVDAISEAPERLALACLADAIAHGATCVNHVEATGLRPGRPHQLDVHDSEGRAPFSIAASVVVNATGPWSDLVARRLGVHHPPAITRSRGIHIITRPLSTRHALLLSTEGRHFFVIPWHGRSLIGTTDTAWTADPDALSVSREDIDDLLRTVNRALPAARLQGGDVEYAYAGLRPLAGAGTSTYTASRRSAITRDGERMFSVIGGKWTTSRAVAAATVDEVVPLLGRGAAPCDTDRAPLPWRRAAVPLDDAADDAEIRRAVSDEMAVTLADIVFRRTHFAILGLGAREAPATRNARLVRWARCAATVTGWTEERTAREVDAVVAALRRVSMWPA